jgi:hypothetical protein
MERQAAKTRLSLVESGSRVPPICGYEYLTRGTGRGRNGARDQQTHNNLTICERSAGAGTTHPNKGLCNYHEWMTTQEPQTAKKQIATARGIAYQSARFFGEPVNVGPHEALLNEVHRSAGIVAWLETKLERLRDDGTPEDDILRQFTKQGIMPSVWMELYQSERKNLVTVAAAAIKAGVAERKVHIAEQQARIIAATMMAFLHDPELGLTPVQMLHAPDIIRKHLAAVPRTELQPSLNPQSIIDANARGDD